MRQDNDNVCQIKKRLPVVRHLDELVSGQSGFEKIVGEILVVDQEGVQHAAGTGKVDRVDLIQSAADRRLGDTRVLTEATCWTREI